MKKLVIKFFMFALISGIGVTIDFLCVGTALAFFDLSPFYANSIGSTLGIIFVFFTSVYKVFINNGRLVLVKFFVYLVYSAGLIYCVSSFIDALYLYEPFLNSLSSLMLDFIHPAIIAKIIITPVTLIVNFIVARFLIEKIKI